MSTSDLSPDSRTTTPRVKPGYRTSELWVLVLTIILCAVNGPLDLGLPHDVLVAMIVGSLTYGGLRSGTKKRGMQLLCIALAGSCLSGCVMVKTADTTAIGLFQSVSGLKVSTVATNGTQRVWSVDKVNGDAAMAEAIARGAAAGATGRTP